MESSLSVGDGVFLESSLSVGGGTTLSLACTELIYLVGMMVL